MPVTNTSAPHWIPVEEHMPERGTYVLVSCVDDHAGVERYVWVAAWDYDDYADSGWRLPKLRRKDGRGGKEMNPCELCEEYGGHDCKHCNLGNPCIGCADYDMRNDACTSEGACGDPVNKWKWIESAEKDE